MEIQQNKLPTISLLLVIRNEEDAVKKAINSLLAQTYPQNLTEYIFIDGMSTDGTREYLIRKVEELRAGGYDAKLFDNPKKILASGWNIGIQNARGELVCRIDAHSEVNSNYVEYGVHELLRRRNQKCAGVGGIIFENVSVNFVSSIIADLFASRFGIGDSPFRVGVKKTCETDTALFAIYPRNIFIELGWFDESLGRSQDIDFHSRAKNSGYNFITNPLMKVRYYVRTSIKGLIKKAFADGYWIPYVRRSSIRHKVPTLFTTYLIILPIMLPLLSWISIIPLFTYLTFAILFAAKDGRSMISKLILPLLYLAFHFSYGFGSIIGLKDRLLGLRS